MDFLKFIFSGFWIFIGFAILLSLILNFILNMWCRFWRHFNLMKHGYPPEHCDADGDFKQTKEEEEN